MRVEGSGLPFANAGSRKRRRRDWGGTAPNGVL